MLNEDEILEAIQRIKELNDLLELYGDRLRNMDPDQLKILELGVLDCLKKIRGN